MSAEPASAAGVDVGGTFTDVVVLAATPRAVKVPTTPADQSAGVRAGLAAAGVSRALLGALAHGTTTATNAVLERDVARTVLVTTEGFADVLEIARQDRPSLYDLRVIRPPHLAAGVVTATERSLPDGTPLEPLTDDEVDRVVDAVAALAPESVAVSLLFGYAGGDHEQRLAEALKARLGIPVTRSSVLLPEFREYERASTCVLNAAVAPLMGRYLARLGDGLTGTALTVMTSAGGTAGIDAVAAAPVHTLLSGPAAGVVAAGAVAASAGFTDALAFDMGGTSTDVCLIRDGVPELATDAVIAGLPVATPAVAIHTVGAGGGSIAALDAGGALTVGPRSAGAVPGPACYGLGGAAATVTDANLVLGRIDPDAFAGGSMGLDRDASDRALLRSVGEQSSMTAAQAALGIVEIVDENMAAAARIHAAERGRELAGRAMIAFGGAAPLHAARLAEKLGIERVIVPANAGVGSAVGFLLAPAAYEVVRSSYFRLRDGSLSALNAIFEEMAAEATAVVRLAAPDESLETRRHAYARYVGQGHEIKIALPEGTLSDADAAAVRAAFEEEYSAQYGRTVPDHEVEILTWSVTVTTPTETEAAPQPERSAADGERRSRILTFPGHDGVIEAAEIDRPALAPGESMTGPAIVAESQTTSVIPPGFTAECVDSGEIILTRRSARPAAGVAAQGVREQVIWDRLIATVEEQAQALIRTAFSTSVREAGDLSAGVFDMQGRMLAQAVTGTPGHVNAMAASVGFFLEKFPPEKMRDGDVYATNDPWLGTGHLFDFTVVTPIFRGGEPVALFASTVHVVDIGGRGFGPDAGEVYEEGLCIPILPMFEAGEPNETLFAIVRENVREPVQVVGDLYSLAACNAVGGKRLLEMMDEFGLNGFDAVGDFIIETSRAAMAREIAKLPAGVYEYDMTVDGYERPLKLVGRMTISADAIDIDFAGTTAASPFGINVPLTYTQAYASFGVRSVVGGDIPNNAGSLAPIRVTAPEGCILNAPRPAAVNIRHVTGQMLPDVVLGCLDQAKPGIAPAEGASALWNPMMIGGRGAVGEYDYGDAEPFTALIFHSGGTGARPGKDGLSATAFPSGVRNTPIEITESISPLIFQRKEFRIDSGGAGVHRGGAGQVIEIEHADGAPFAVFALFDRIDHPARGRQGGLSGAAGGLSLASGRKLKGKGKQIVPPGDRLIMELPGGGGLGAPPAE